MLTRCPACGTTFRVKPEQLKTRRGRVRCGQCQGVFNALDTLIDKAASPNAESAMLTAEIAPAPVFLAETPPVAAEPTPAEPEHPAAEEAPPAVSEDPISPDTPAHPFGDIPTIGLSASEPAPAAETTDTTNTESEPAEPAAAAIAEHTPASPDLPDRTPTEAVSIPASPAAPPPAEAESPAPAPQGIADDWLREPAPRPSRRWPWLAGSALAFLLLGTQIVLGLRTELAIVYPATKPLLLAACSVFGCDLPLPRKVELVSIESSDLHPDTASNQKLTLVASLRNRAPFAQEYPHLELTLTDGNDQPLSRRVLAPADYLPQDALVTEGFKPATELALNLTIEAPDVAAAGYRLYLFYP